MTRKRLDLIQKIDKITTVVGTIIDSLISNSRSDAPSIFAVKNYFNKGIEENEGNTYSGLASDYGINVAKIEGNYEQQTTKGINLLDMSKARGGTSNGISCTVDKDGLITSNGTSNNDFINIWLLGNYYTTIIEENVLFTLSPGKKYFIKDILLFSSINGSVTFLNPGVTTIDSTSYPNGYKVTGVRHLNVIDGTTLKNKKYYPIVVESGVPVDWEIYTGGMSSPNPEYPQEVKNVEISEFTSYSNQLFDASKLPTRIKNGITFTNNSNGSFNINGATSADTHAEYICVIPHKDLVKMIKKGKLFFNKINNTSYDSGYAFCRFYIANEVIGTIRSYENYSMFEITNELISNPDFYIGVGFFCKPSGVFNLEAIKPMLYQDGDGTWEPFKLDTTTLDTPLTLRALPNGVCDTYENGIITRRVGEITFDGSSDENWSMNINIRTRFALDILDMKNHGANRVSCLANIFYSMLNGNNNGGTFFYERNIFIYPPSDITTVKLLKTWLQSNNLKVYYELKTPKTEQFYIPTLPSYYPYTNVLHNSNLEAKNILWNINASSMNVSNNMDTFNTDKIAPSINAVNNEINNLKDNGLAVSDTLVKKSQFLFDGDESELPSYLKKVDPPFSNPNLIVNSNFQVWQEGETIRVEKQSSKYAADVWYCENIRTDTYINVSRIKSDVGKGLGLSASTNGLRVYYRIELKDIEFCDKKNITISHSINKEIFTKTIEVNISDEDRTKGYYSIFYISLKQDDVLNWVKVELGNIATPFVPRSYDEELMLCQRYYQNLNAAVHIRYSYSSPTSYFTGINFLKMRCAPTVKCYDSDNSTIMNVSNVTDNSIYQFYINSDKSAVGVKIYLDARFY